MNALKLAQYDYSSAQVHLPSELASVVRRMARDIDERDLLHRETVPHITLKYGLHSTDPQPVRSVLTSEPPIKVRFGRTEIFELDDEDVVYVKVFSPDLRRLNEKLKRLSPHTEEHPQYQPHVTVAHVKKGRGKKYTGRSDLENKTHTFEAVRFSKPSGRKTTIGLSKAAQNYLGRVTRDHPWLTNPLTLGAVGGLGGAAAGRFVAAPILSRLLGLDPKRARLIMMLLGGAAGMAPAIMTALARKRLKGSYFASGGPPVGLAQQVEHDRYAMGNRPTSGIDFTQRLTGRRPFQPPDRKPYEITVPISGLTKNESAPRDMVKLAWDIAERMLRLPRAKRAYCLENLCTDDETLYALVKREMSELRKSAGLNPRIYDQRLWRPTFAVAQSMDEISNNPMIPISHKVTMRRLIAQAGQDQGIGFTGSASTGSLMSALPKVIRHAIPTVGGAWAVSKLLGAPRRLKQTAIGGALVYSALKGFMSKGGSIKKEGGFLHALKRLAKPGRTALREVGTSAAAGGAGYVLGGVGLNQLEKRYQGQYGKSYQYSPESREGARWGTAAVLAALANPRLAGKLIRSKKFRKNPSTGEHALTRSVSPLRLAGAAALPFAPTAVASQTDKVKKIMNQFQDRDLVSEMTTGTANLIGANMLDPSLAAVERTARDYVPVADNFLGNLGFGALVGSAASVPAYLGTRALVSSILGRAELKRREGESPDRAMDRRYAQQRRRDTIAKIMGMLVGGAVSIPVSAYAYSRAPKWMQKLRGMGKKSSMKKKLPDGYVLDEEQDDGGGKLWRRRTIRHGEDKVGFLTENPHEDGIEIRGVYVKKSHRGKGLARFLLRAAADRNRGQRLVLMAKSFKDHPMDDEQLKGFYRSEGFKDEPSGALSKMARLKTIFCRYRGVG